jgi:hypothetical protein
LLFPPSHSIIREVNYLKAKLWRCQDSHHGIRHQHSKRMVSISTHRDGRAMQ